MVVTLKPGQELVVRMADNAAPRVANPPRMGGKHMALHRFFRDLCEADQ